MKYDKYGDPIMEAAETADPKTQKAFLVMVLLQSLLVIFNILIMVVDTLNLYLCFITAPIYIFLYITFLKGYSNKKDDMILPAYCKIARILCPVLYVVTAILAVFAG